MPRPHVVYVVPDKMGGMMNIIAHLLEHRRDDGFDHHAVLTHNHRSTDTRFGGALAATTQTTVEYSLPDENLHAVMRRLARAIPEGPGVVVAGDLLDLAMLSTHDVGKAVVLMLHGDSDYYYDLARKHDHVIHAFIAYSRRMHDRLADVLPHRRDDILHLPYGIPMPARTRSPRRPGDPLRLVFSGRLEHGQKGVFDLPLIDAALKDHRSEATWTIIGSGPDEETLRDLWPESDRVAYVGRLPNSAVVDALATHDVFVLPTRSEGFPVALLEAMACGLVPVVSAIDSGVPEVVHDGVTGFLPPVGDVAAFAAAIDGLDRDTARLEAVSRAAAEATRQAYDVRTRVAAYHALYAGYLDLYRPLSPQARLQYGSRLDRPWIPNPLVRFVRSTIRGSR